MQGRLILTERNSITHVMPDIENEVHIMKALEETPYGSCVFESDNDGGWFKKEKSTFLEIIC